MNKEHPLRTPGWYPNPDDPATLRWWNGTNFDGDTRTADSFAAEALPKTPSTEIPTDMPASNDPAHIPGDPSDKTFLWWSYVLGILIPVYGFGAAAYIAVAERRAKIRRHAIGVGAAAAIALAIYLLIFLAGSGARSDAQVANDLTNLLMNNGTSIVFATNVRCAHQGGNEYICTYDANGSHTVLVTDDGNTISEAPY